MPQLTIYHLAFLHGLHIGRGGVESVTGSLEYVPSDTLFAALVDTWVHLGRNVEEILSAEDASPAFKVTSAFPFAGDVRFYPRPVDLSAIFSETLLETEGAGKRIKKIRYISEELLLKAAQGEKLDAYLFPEDEYKEPKNGIALQGGALWLLKEEVPMLPDEFRQHTRPDGRKEERPLFALRRQKVFAMHVAPRVTVDRINSASNLFQSERVVFSDGCGLWFGAVGQDAMLSELLPILGENGLGGERSVGYGAFCVKKKSRRVFNVPNGRSYLLSRWHPGEDEVSLLHNPSSAYRLEAVSGWLRTTGAAAQRRKRVWMVAEGSLIVGNPRGKAVNVAPEYHEKTGQTVPHPVYRSGFVVAVGWKGGDDA